MPDLTDLLDQAAGPASSPLDVSAVASRARVLQRRRTVARTGTGAALAAALVVTSLRLVPGPGAQGLDLQPATQAPSPSLSAAATARPSGLAQLVAPRDPAAGPAGGPKAAAVQPTPNATRPASAQPEALASPSASQRSGPAYPRQAGCSVTTEGALPDETRTCRFEATASGGYVVRWIGGVSSSPHLRYDIIVRSGNDFTRYQNRATFSQQECRSFVIRPGDRVSVSLQAAQASEGVDLAEARAGADVGC